VSLPSGALPRVMPTDSVNSSQLTQTSLTAPTLRMNNGEGQRTGENRAASEKGTGFVLPPTARRMPPAKQTWSLFRRWAYARSGAGRRLPVA